MSHKKETEEGNKGEHHLNKNELTLDSSSNPHQSTYLLPHKLPKVLAISGVPGNMNDSYKESLGNVYYIYSATQKLLIKRKFG